MNQENDAMTFFWMLQQIFLSKVTNRPGLSQQVMTKHRTDDFILKLSGHSPKRLTQLSPRAVRMDIENPPGGLIPRCRDSRILYEGLG